MDKLIGKFKFGLQRTKTMIVRNIQSIFSDTGEWNEEAYDRLEEALIQADIGVNLTEQFIVDIRNRYNTGLIHTSADILDSAREIFLGLFDQNVSNTFTLNGKTPTVIMFVGVNGSGKTTTVGKLAQKWKQEGKTVLLAACDTFRAAAIEQLHIWGERVGCSVISAKHGADAAAVAYDAVQAALARKSEILLIDTAGRQHTRKGLMDELAKVTRIINRAHPGAPHQTWLVVDGSTGTNALQQARAFKEYVGVNGLCITKLDGSSKGGVVLAIQDELKLPIYFVGLGEGVNDLQPFNAEMYTSALLEI